MRGRSATAVHQERPQSDFLVKSSSVLRMGRESCGFPEDRGAKAPHMDELLDSSLSYSLEDAGLWGNEHLVWELRLPTELHHCVQKGALEKLKNISLCPPSAPQQLVCSGGLGFDCLINHMVWTAGLKRKLHVSRPGAVLWSNDQGQGLYYSAPPTQISLLGDKIP